MLVDDGEAGSWATATIAGHDLAAPNLLPYEVANALRRLALASIIGHDQAAQAHADLVDLTVEHWTYELLAPRAWQLRANASIYDASYLALAELLDAPLVTLDRRLTGLPDTRCHVVTPSAGD